MDQYSLIWLATVVGSHFKVSCLSLEFDKKNSTKRDSLNTVLIAGAYSHQYYDNKKNYTNTMVTKKN